MELHLDDPDSVVALCVAKLDSWVRCIDTESDVCLPVLVEGIKLRRLIPKDAHSRCHSVSAAARFLHPTRVINLSDPANDGKKFSGIVKFDAQ